MASSGRSPLLVHHFPCSQGHPSGGWPRSSENVSLCLSAQQGKGKRNRLSFLKTNASRRLAVPTSPSHAGGNQLVTQKVHLFSP